jgi:hypothetical protein
MNRLLMWLDLLKNYQNQSKVVLLKIMKFQFKNAMSFQDQIMCCHFKWKMQIEMNILKRQIQLWL